MKRAFPLILATLGLMFSLSAGRPAAAQMGGMGMGGMPGGGPMGGSRKPAPAPNPKEPQTHAASGASDDLPKVTGSEPSLPTDPLAISPEVKKRIGTDFDYEAVEKGRGPTISRTWVGPWYSEKSGQYGFRTLFPLWAERRQPNDRASLFGPVYFNRRSTKHDADVLFPIFWNMRDEDRHTTIVGPVFHHSAPGESDTWVAPLVFSGSRPDGGYLYIPPLLTFTHHDKNGGFNLFGPGFCSWKGPSCSPSTAEDIDYGVAPFFFAGKSETSRYELAPPLLHYFRYNEVDDSSLNIWGPLIWKHERERDAFDVAPLFWHSWGKNEDHVTLLPLFHYGYSGNSRLFINPLFITAHGDAGESTFITWLYARYRGRTKLDMVTPLYWHYEDPDIGLNQYILPPLLYLSSSPRGYDTVVFPFFAHSKRPGLSESTWITPFVQHSTDLQGWETNIHPFIYVGRSLESSHTVVFPFFWDFASPKSRTTVGFPIYWRFADDHNVSQLMLNTYYHEHRVGSELDWEFHFFPAFSYGETPDGHWWNVLFGFAGYTRRGAMTQVRALWVPITLTDGPTL